ncbi:MAG: CinA family nicotinamide mononucleotide deamidase-related protein [Anaerolineaceae bacterium]|nr:CinA family nicotinamide mononucleotide deamidase-related protein [Anaerolineaceae bacterium]
MPAAEIIAIGTELLLGEIQDTNTQFLARTFRDAGIDLYRTTMIGDNAERIAQAIRESLTRCDIIITTGGLGPTVDDPTRLAVAQAMGVDIEFRPELWEQIKSRFARYGRQATDNNRRQAYIPQGAQAIENPVGTAPAFRFEIGQQVIISLPGVPKEMEFLIEQCVMPYLKERYQLQGIIKALVLHTAGIGESQVDEYVGDLEAYGNPTVGLLAHSGQTDIRITAKAGSPQEADRMIADVAQVVRSRLGAHIYGQDQDTLEKVVQAQLESKGLGLVVLECGMEETLLKRFLAAGLPMTHSEIVPESCSSEEFRSLVFETFQNRSAVIVLGAIYRPGVEKQELTLYCVTPQGSNETIRSYGGPPASGLEWASTTALDYLRRGMNTNHTNSL